MTLSTIRLSILTFVIFMCSCGTLADLGIKPTTFETLSAVKEVMNSSAFRALKTLAQLNQDDPLAMLPAEAQPVIQGMKMLGLGSEMDVVTKQISKASALIVNEGQGIMADAIKEVKITDAAAIILGGESAATAVLKDAMYATVKKRYSTRLDTELDKTEAKQYWPMAAAGYNLFAKEKVDATLTDFVAERSVDAVFLAMGKQEKDIRKDPKALGKAVVTKVFDYYEKKQK